INLSFPCRLQCRLQCQNDYEVQQKTGARSSEARQTRPERRQEKAAQSASERASCGMNSGRVEQPEPQAAKPAVAKHHLRMMSPAEVMANTDTSGHPAMTLGGLQIRSVADAILFF